MNPPKALKDLCMLLNESLGNHFTIIELKYSYRLVKSTGLVVLICRKTTYKYKVRSYTIEDPYLLNLLKSFALLHGISIMFTDINHVGLL